MSRKTTARSSVMAKMYMSGKMLKEIGEVYGISYEAVRKAIKPHNIPKGSGGRFVLSQIRLSKSLADKDAASIKRHGCAFNKWKEICKTDGKPSAKYTAHKANAKTRGISWKFNLWTWWKVWGKSGVWHLRGKLGHNYVMSRFNDIGPYSPDNVIIVTASENCAERIRIGGNPMHSLKNKPC